jgi:hypothetical protein
MAVTTTRKASALVLVLIDTHFQNPKTAPRSSEGLQGSLGKEWPEDSHSERSEESRSVPQASLGKEWLEGCKIDSLAHFTCRRLVLAMIQ